MDFSLTSDARWAYFWDQVSLVWPEIWLVIGMCAVVIAPMLPLGKKRVPLVQGGIVVTTLIAALIALAGSSDKSGIIFHGSMAIDPFSQFFKILLYVFTGLIVVQWFIVRAKVGQPDAQKDFTDTPDFMCLLLGATFGMSMMASANNLLMLFIATEAASLPSFALAGFLKTRKLSTESSLKYVLFGAASSSIMLYGMSLVYGCVGTLDLAAVANAATGVTGLAGEAGVGMTPLFAVGLMAMFAGLAFKLSAVPLHFWCPDVFQGAPIEVTTFLSVASKGAAVIMLTRLLGAFGEAASALPANQIPDGLFYGITTGIAILGGVTAFWGNLLAYHQSNIKRLLAYSSIAHAGYMIMAVSVIAIAGRPGSTLIASDVASAVLFYILIYVFMNTGAFTIAALIAQKTGSEDINDYAELHRRSPILAALMLICLLSLFGMPGLGGFWAKIYLAAGIVEAGWGGVVIVSVLFVNTLLSFFYYMRPIIIMYLKQQDRATPAFRPNTGGLALVGVCGFVLLLTGIFPSVLDTGAHGTIVHRALPQAELEDNDAATADKNAPEAPDASLRRVDSNEADKPATVPTGVTENTPGPVPAALSAPPSPSR